VITYLGSPNNQLQAHAANGMPVLISFAIAERSKWLRQYIPSYTNLLVDSGAYTAHTQGTTINGPRYVDWCAQWLDTADNVAGIDSIAGDYRVSWDNYMQYGGFPTIHDTDPIDFLSDLIDLAQTRGNWLGIGLKPPREGKENFIRTVCDQVPDGMHIHGWALRAYSHIPRIDSVDSTNWWRDAMDLRCLPLCKHLTYGETLEIVIKRYARWQPVLKNDPLQTDLFGSNG